MALSFRDRAAKRAAEKHAAIDRLHRAGRHGEPFHLADGWVLSELAKVARRRPRDAPAVYEAVTAGLAKLAESIPLYKPDTKGGSDAAS